MTRWGADPFSRGAYSYVAFGSTPADFDALAEAQGRVHFAGEACIREYYATVHGAYYSGQRAAAEILGEEYVLPVPKEQGLVVPHGPSCFEIIFVHSTLKLSGKSLEIVRKEYAGRTLFKCLHAIHALLFLLLRCV